MTSPARVASRVDARLVEARRSRRRLTPEEAWAAVQDGALLIDTRTPDQRARQGELPGALVIDRTVLEWRLDPSSPWRIPEATDLMVQVVVLCRQGYSSSLAAESLQRLGLVNATDVIGGVEAWTAAGLPIARRTCRRAGLTQPGRGSATRWSTGAGFLVRSGSTMPTSAMTPMTVNPTV